MLKIEAVEMSADPAIIFAALGDATRLELVSRLGDGGSHSISHLSEGLQLSRQGVTKHLRVLERAGLVHSSKVGRENQYRYAPERLIRAKDYLEQVSAQWDGALSRLKLFVEDQSNERNGKGQ